MKRKIRKMSGETHAINTVGDGRIPAIGCGTFELRGETCARIVAEALQIGYRHVDTAQGYGNEAAVGEGIRASGIPRTEIFVTTKVRPQVASEGALQRSAEESLERLKLDYVDLLLIHWPKPGVPIHETVSALSDAQRRGMTRHIGVSNFTIANLAEAVATSPAPLVANQVEYHPYLDQTKLITEIKRHGLALIAYCPMALGKVARDPVLEEIGKQHGKTAVQVALRWLVQQPGVAAIPRTSKSERLAENLDIFDFQLTAAEMDRVSRLKRPNSRLINEPAWVPVWD
jgi:diketogulonate reductase-like aldo/keto reductase